MTGGGQHRSGEAGAVAVERNFCNQAFPYNSRSQDQGDRRVNRGVRTGLFFSMFLLFNFFRLENVFYNENSDNIGNLKKKVPYNTVIQRNSHKIGIKKNPQCTGGAKGELQHRAFRQSYIFSLENCIESLHEEKVKK